MTIQQAKADRREAQLREWKAKLDQLKARADQFTADAKIEFYREYDSLDGRLESLRRLWNETAKSSGAALTDLKSGFEVAARDFQKAFEDAASRFGGSAIR